jgi:MFS family permease
VRAGAYVALLRTRGIARLAGAFLTLGIGNTMTPVALVLFARSATHSFATASLVLAGATAGSLVFGPARGRLIDRVGPRRAVMRLAIPDVLTDVAFIVAGQSGVGAGVLVALGFVSGATTAPVMAAVRSLWSRELTDDATRQAGFALMTILQETTFIVGPLVAAVLIGLWSATAAMVGTTVLSAVGAIVFVTSADREQDVGAARLRPANRLPVLAGPGIRTVVASSAGFGLTFGLLDVAFPAFARAHGSTASAGILLSAFAAGSLGGGFVYGLRGRAGPSGPRYPWLCLLSAAGLAPLIIEPGLAGMAALAALSGLCFAPVTTAQLAVIDEVAPSERRAEAFTWLGTIYGTGLAVGAAAAGQLIAHSSIRAALIAACAATLAAGVVATARSATLRS